MRHQFRRSTLWLVLFIATLAGLGLGYGHRVLILPWLIVPLALLSLRRRSWLTLILIMALGLSLGWWRGAVHKNQLSSYAPYYDKKVTLLAVAKEDAAYNKYKQLTFTAGDIVIDGQRLPGKLQVSGFGANAVFAGDEVVATGKLKPGRGGEQGRLSFATLRVAAHHPSLVSNLRRKFVAGMQNALPEPLASFAMGLLIGQRATLPDSVKQDLLMVGLTHIIAVSGYNLTIILQASRRLLGKRSKRVSTFLSVSLIGVFLLLAGASASIVRAAIVSLLSIMTAYYGRSFRPLNLICLAAVITAWANPVYIWSDLSWYLSFLAFFGVMVLAPLVRARWLGRWQNSLLLGVALESICAEIMTLPLILHVFGQMSRAGLVANVLVATLIPLAMLLSLIAGLAGMLVPAIASWLAWPALTILNYMLDLAHILAHLPHIFVEGIGLTLSKMLLLYAILGLLVTVLWRKSDKNAIITEMNDLKTGSLQA